MNHLECIFHYSRKHFPLLSRYFNCQGDYELFQFCFFVFCPELSILILSWNFITFPWVGPGVSMKTKRRLRVIECEELRSILLVMNEIRSLMAEEPNNVIKFRNKLSNVSSQLKNQRIYTVEVFWPSDHSSTIRNVFHLVVCLLKSSGQINIHLIPVSILIRISMQL